jgi:hypothetical protein
LNCQAVSAPTGKVLVDPVLRGVQIGKAGVLDPINLAKACLQILLPGSDLVLVREAHQHGHQSLLLVEDHHAVLIEAGRHADGLKGEAHAAA